MNPLDPALYDLDEPAGPGMRLQRLLDLVNRTAVLHAELLLCLVGLALLMLLLAPDRHRRAVERLSRHGWGSFLLGAVALTAVVAVLAVLAAHGIRLGRPLLVFLITTGAATGLSVCARALGERMWPERGAVAQSCLGLTALVLPLACLPGLPVLLVAAPLGLGAWLRPEAKA